VVPGCNYTRAFARLVVSLRPMMTIKDIAMHLGVSESMIRGIDKRYLKRNFGRPRLKRLKVLAIDEIYIGKAKKFLTIVIDWTTGAIVFVGEGKGEKALKSFWKRLQGSGAKIEAVATDMSSAYFAAVQKNLPNAKLVFDRFHIVKLMNEKLDLLRREVQNEADTMLKKTIKGLRWLLLKHSDNLDPERNEAQRLQEALELNRSLHIGYYLKEDLAQIWTQESMASAAILLDDWCRRARATGIRLHQTMASTAGPPNGNSQLV
jgi:transposase